MKGAFGKADLMPFMSALPREMRQRWPNRKLAIHGNVHGNLQHLQLKKCGYIAAQCVAFARKRNALESHNAKAIAWRYGAPCKDRTLRYGYSDA